ncbi:unnamed protein product [Linum tenue]|uniref:Molybdenum cofactor sulfurase n=1 Tax=Linum tenue TaxID=586396 RepID=A0AAV0JY56_9ROSI|nr:unnamed protein product [Linum tenue]
MSSFCGKRGDSATCHCGFCRLPLLAILKPSPQTQPLISHGGRHRDFEASMASYLETEQADRIREGEYSHLSVSDHACLDYVGHGLFSHRQQQIQSPDAAAASTSSSAAVHYPIENPFFEISHKSVSLNFEVKHGSGCPESELESRIGKRIMQFMNISDEEYGVVFTANEPSAFKLVADCYPFATNRNLLTVYDHENDAVETMTKAAMKRGARVSSAEFSWPELRIETDKLQREVVGKKKRKKKGLFVFPAKSRVTGASYSYLWMNLAQENGWHVLLDASALAPKEMETLGFSLFRPDLLICPFYKVFGENPSGFGCLIVRKSIAASILEDSDKAASIVRLNAPAASSLEFRGLDHADELGLIAINARARLLVNWLVNSLLRLRHPSSGGVGVQLVRIYGPGVEFDRGTAVGFNVFDWRGERVDPAMVQKLAGRKGISLGCGSLRNLGSPGKRDGGGIAVVTAAIGMVTNFADVHRVWGLVSRFLDADFVEKERWRYTVLNQNTVEV